MSVEDSHCEKQIKETNALGNALLTGLIGESIILNKKNIKIASSLGHLCEAVKSYKIGIGKLKSLQIGACSDILNVKEGTDFGRPNKSISDNLSSVMDVLKSHVNHNASKVVSKQELGAWSEQMEVIESLRDELVKQSSGNRLKKHSEMIREIANNLRRISTSIETVKTLTDQMQSQAVLDSAATLYFSGYNSENGEIKMPF